MTKIEALKKTIFNLENDVYEYSWQDTNSCNCGVLAKTILNGEDPRECGLYGYGEGKGLGAFSRKAYCLTTNQPLPLVFQSLKDTGFTYDELRNLEFLSDKKIAGKCGVVVSSWHEDQDAAHGQFNDKECLIKYLKAWVQILQEEEVASQPEKPTEPAHIEQVKVIEKTVYVSVPTSISEQSKELILS